MKLYRFTATSYVALSLLALGACKDFGGEVYMADAKRFSSNLELVCNDAIRVANIVGLVPGVGTIVPYISVGCGTAEGLARLASDPSSVQWVSEQIGKMKELGIRVGVKVS